MEIYSEYLFVALVIKHEKSLYLIIISCVVCLALRQFFPNYFINS
jgi:hypothetical protein